MMMIQTRFKLILAAVRAVAYGFSVGGGKPTGRNMKKMGESFQQHLAKEKTKIKIDEKNHGKPDNSKHALKSQTKQLNWKKYDRQLSQIFQTKKEPLDIDLIFLARKLQHKQLSLDPQLSSTVKLYIKQLKSIQFSLIPELLELSFSIGLINPPQIFLNSYLEYYKNNIFSIQENQALNFPSYFLKKVGYELLMVLGNKSMEEFVTGLKHFGSILSLNELKKIDEFCCGRAGKVTVDQMVKLLNIFRQIRKKGVFVELAEGVLIVKQKEMSCRSLIMAGISFLQLGNREAFAKLQDNFSEKIEERVFNPPEIVSVMHILHKYKVGNLRIWSALHSYFLEKDKKIMFEHIFVLMSGLSRNYKLMPELLTQLIEYDPTLKYAETLKDKQFVEFYFVIYSHFTQLSNEAKLQYQPILKQSLSSLELTSIYVQIRHFFLFLFEFSPPQKKQHLRKSYPNDTLISLLSLVYPFQNADIRQSQQYQQDLLTRISPELWSHHKPLIIAEQFLRYKLISSLRKTHPFDPI